MDLTVAVKSPRISFLFGILAIITGVILIGMVGGFTFSRSILIILALFWIVTGVIALWIGYIYLRNLRYSKPKK